MIRRRSTHSEEGPGYWPTFVDAMSVVVLVVVFVLVVSFIQTAVQVEHRVIGRQAVLDVLERRMEVTTALERELGKDSVSVSSDGNIAFKGDVLFWPDTAELRNTHEVEQLMSKLARSIGDVLEQERVQKGLQVILVEGHTATDDLPPSTHWWLSARRAQVIVEALQKRDSRLTLRENAQFLGAAGRANYRPAVEGTSEEAKSRNRRVEIRMVLKDEGLRDALLEALSK